MKQGQTEIEKSNTVNYSKPEQFKIICKRCGLGDCQLTIKHFGKIKIVCRSCGSVEM